MKQVRLGVGLLLVAGLANLWLTYNVNSRANKVTTSNIALTSAVHNLTEAQADRAAAGDATVSQFRQLAGQLQSSLDQILGQLRDQVQALQSAGTLTQAQADRLMAVGSSSPVTTTAPRPAPSTSPAVPAPSSPPPTSTAPSSPTMTITSPPSCIVRVLALSLCVSG